MGETNHMTPEQSYKTTNEEGFGIKNDKINTVKEFHGMIEDGYDIKEEICHKTEEIQDQESDLTQMKRNITEVVVKSDDDSVQESDSVDPLQIKTEIPDYYIIVTNRDGTINESDKETNKTSDDKNFKAEINEEMSIEIDESLKSEKNDIDIEMKIEIEDHSAELDNLTRSDEIVDVYECTTCGENFPYLTDEFLNHHKKHTKSKILHVCVKCKLYFLTNSSLVSHRENNHVEGGIACEACGIKFKYKDEYAEHLKSNDDCDINVKRNDKKKLEIINAKKTVVYKCTMCVKRFSFKMELVNHLIEHYSVNSVDSVNDLNLNAVVRSTRDNRRRERVVCEICGKLTLNIHQHLRRHSTVDETSPCRFCSEIFTTKKQLMKHESIEHPNLIQFNCETCMRSFRNKRNYKTHLSKHGNEKRFECETCGKSFVDAQNLSLHNRIHTNDKRYECIVCGKKFVQSHNLTLHKRIHTGETPYKCTECGAEYSFSSNYLQHMRTKHKADIPIIKKNHPENTIKTKRKQK